MNKPTGADSVRKAENAIGFSMMSPTNLPAGFDSPEHFLSAIIDSSDDAIITKDLNGIVTSWNKGAERIFAYMAEEMAGADVTMLCSVLLTRGIEHIATIEREMRAWMEQHEYESVEQLKGCVSQQSCPDPAAFERAQCMRAVSTTRVGGH